MTALYIDGPSDKKKISGWEIRKQLDRKEKGNLRNEVPEFPIYHYTTMETLWKILENDTFWATQARFSNDSAEFDEGEKIIRKKVLSETEPFVDNGKPKNYFIICFCESDNLLSQWREYARGGVSLGFDFSRKSMFRLMPTDNEDKKCIEPNSRTVYSHPIKVRYMSMDESENTTMVVKGKEQQVTTDELQLLIEPPEGMDSEDFAPTVAALGTIPYIKHIGFQEERESRLVFDLNNERNGKYIHYFDMVDKEGWKRPFLKVKYGSREAKIGKCRYIQVGTEIEAGTRQKILDKISKYGPISSGSIGIVDTAGDSIYIGDGEDQEQVYNSIKRLVDSCRSQANKPSIWCDGHWPITSITIGPSNNQQIIYESILNYIQNTYWLNFVKLIKSSTPYREKKY